MKKLSIRILLILLLVLPGLGCKSSPEEKLQGHLSKALEYIENKENKAAIIELKNVIQLDAKHAEARYHLGLLYLEEGDPRGAFQELTRAADLDPGNIDANLKAAEFYLLSRQKEESRKLLDRILEIDPSYPDALALLANLELIDGNYEQAMAALESIGAEVGKSDRLLNIQGRIYAAQKDWTNAEASFQKARELNEENFTTYTSLLAIYQSQKQPEKAKELLLLMESKFPESIDTRLMLAAMYSRENNLEKMVGEFEKILAIEPDNPKHRLRLADYYIKTNQRDQGEEVLQAAIVAIPDDPDLKSFLATSYFDRGNYQKARQELDAILAATPDNQGAKLLEARFILKDGQTQEGVAILQQLTTDNPRWANPFYELGLVHFNRGEIELASLNVSKAIELDKRNTGSRTLMSQILTMEGDFQGAKEEAIAALKLNPQNARAAIILSRALIGKKDYATARDLLLDMESKIADNPVILRNLALAYLGLKDQEQAGQTLAKVVALAPDDVRSLSLLIALQYKDDLPAATDYVLTQIEKAPDVSQLYVLLGGLYQRQKMVEEALQAYQKAQELDPGNSRAFIASGQLLSITGRADEARENYQKMVAQNPESIPGRMGLAALYDAEGRFDLSSKEYREILELDPGYAAAANNLAWIIASSPDGDLGEALRLAMIAKQAFPEDPNITDTLGWVQLKRESYSLAIAQFEEALSNRPGDPTISYHLALALHGAEKNDETAKLLAEILASGQNFAEKKDAMQLLKTIQDL